MSDEEKTEGFQWKGWRYAIKSLALSIAHAALWATVWTLVTAAFQHFGLLKK